MVVNTENMTKNTIINKILTQQQPKKMEQNKTIETKEEPMMSICFCKCYKADSFDSRCCGVCYCCGCRIINNEDKEKHCYFCPNTFSEYWDSGYVQTTAGYGNPEADKNGVCCWLCFFPKLALFWPCLFGSLANNCINCIRKTDSNYLF